MNRPLEDKIWVQGCVLTRLVQLTLSQLTNGLPRVPMGSRL